MRGPVGRVFSEHHDQGTLPQGPPRSAEVNRESIDPGGLANRLDRLVASLRPTWHPAVKNRLHDHGQPNTVKRCPKALTAVMTAFLR
jgi:hypothetical protein